ncbi:MAG: LysR family transcriptional regulator [Pigmentiphaga sp.]|uniref:LysR family transcriptional regulator n=1 Tax=Pigmentiphaga sp. TaxID=1977564 RepID=UPI00299FEAFD|nr:LysR family transcriptional regulator [Pigmentiphaga sp.]MDX3905684.1 LysR family transcriptional regulator [Pigmentiphaga sp.]
MNLSRFDLVTLALFVATARQGSISAGARRLNLAVGAASRRIADLEDAVKTPLFYRHASGVELTGPGQACLQHAMRILQDVERMAGMMSDYATGARGQVRIAANTSSITQFLPEDLAGFMARHPGIRVELEEQNSSAIVASIAENRADVGIFADRTPAPGLVTYPYREDELVLIVPRAHSLAARGVVSFRDTLDYEYVSLPDATSLASRMLEESSRLDHPLKLRIQVRSFDGICRMVATGMGIGILPRIAAAPHAQSMDLVLVALDDPWARRSLLLGVRSPEALTAPARLLAAHLCADMA